jgi:lipoprotein
MKKLLVLLSILTLLTGCTVTKINKDSIDKVIDSVMKKDSKLKNVHFEGYSYYVPRGIRFVDKKEYNAILKDEYNNNYYLYVDVISYYHKVKEKYKVNKKAYYSKEVKTKDKFGYVEIKEDKTGYLVEAMYNYAKIEAYVEKDSLNDAMTNISMILSSMKYNDKVLSSTVGENILSYKEESYNIFKTKEKTSDFLDYVKEYDNYDQEKKDEDNLKIDEE